ncbi:S1 family peptidase [Streptosporangium sp. NPDC023615]|uniref:S1 family peptidase n=1 Tax=Streptosporangium sp. NPDC023615 TaxID=3154794 RepID=UPI00343F3EFC
MPRNHTAVMSRAMAFTALTVLAGAGLLPLAAGADGSGAAQAPPSSRATRAPGARPAAPRPATLRPVASLPTHKASPSPQVPWVPPDMLEALQRDLGLTREQVQKRLLNEIVLASVEARLREELGDRFGGSWFNGPLSQTLVVATTSVADRPRITAAGASPSVVRWSLTQLTPIRKRIDEVLSAHPAGASVRYVDVRLNKVVVLTRTPTVTARIIRSTGVDPAAVVVLPSTERPVPSRASRPGRARPGEGGAAGAAGTADPADPADPAGPVGPVGPRGAADTCPVRWACAPR